ncbi:hypothetical protein [Massiliimalia massiliensis]|nr:hypothetical protein [Massiliimalia massiliensis]
MRCIHRENGMVRTVYVGFLEDSFGVCAAVRQTGQEREALFA